MVENCAARGACRAEENGEKTVGKNLENLGNPANPENLV